MLGDFFNGLCALEMSLAARKPLVLRPSTVAVHNNRNVTGYLFGFNAEVFGGYS